MPENPGSEPKNGFRDFFAEVEPLRIWEPFAQTLGVFEKENAVMEYSFLDVVKMMGHACPTTAGAYLCCRQALKALYRDETPIRGDIAITVCGDPDEGVYGVIGQVFTLLTGAAPENGFRGLGHKFKRKDLLVFNPQKIDSQALCFEFTRLDTGQTVLVKFYPHRIPFPTEKSKRMGELMQKVLWETAKQDEIRQFQDLWMEKVSEMLVKQTDISQWIEIETRQFRQPHGGIKG